MKLTFIGAAHEMTGSCTLLDCCGGNFLIDYGTIPLPALDHDIRFVGFPREDGSSGSAFTASVTLCITTACKDKADAWAFIRSTLSEEYQKNLWNFPILRSPLTPHGRESHDAGISDRRQRQPGA